MGKTQPLVIRQLSTITKGSARPCGREALPLSHPTLDIERWCDPNIASLSDTHPGWPTYVDFADRSHQQQIKLKSRGLGR